MTTAFAESFARLFNKKKERKTKRKIGFTEGIGHCFLRGLVGSFHCYASQACSDQQREKGKAGKASGDSGFGLPLACDSPSSPSL